MAHPKLQWRELRTKVVTYHGPGKSTTDLEVTWTANLSDAPNPLTLSYCPERNSAYLTAADPRGFTARRQDWKIKPSGDLADTLARTEQLVFAHIQESYRSLIEAYSSDASPRG